MGIYKDFRVPGIEDLLKACGILRICFNEIPVQIQVTAVAAKAVSKWPILVSPGCAGSVVASVDIIQWNDTDHDVRRKLISFKQVPCEHHAGINAFWFPRVNTIVDQQYTFILLADQGWIKGFVFRKDE